jgi:Tol biopolymer transport system component
MRKLSCVLILLVVVFAASAQTPPGFELTLFDLDGTRKVVGRLPGTVYAPRISPDGGRIAFETRDPAGPDGPRLWVAELSNLAARRPLAPAPGPMNWAPMWSVDGERLVYIVSGERPDAVYWRRSDGTGNPEHLLDTRSAEGWMPGGSQMRFLTLTGNGDYGISVFDMAMRKATKLIDLPGSAQHSSAVSPDGRWMAYASNETGRYEVWLEPLPSNGKRYQLTRNGGSHPLWSPDGQSLYFDRTRQLFRLQVNFKDLASAVEPNPLPIKGFVQAEYRRQFDLMPNGTQFLVLVPVAAQ